MEEQADLRRQLKLLESKNTALMQSNIGKDNFYFENSDLIIGNISRVIGVARNVVKMCVVLILLFCTFFVWSLLIFRVIQLGKKGLNKTLYLYGVKLP